MSSRSSTTFYTKLLQSYGCLSKFNPMRIPIFSWHFLVPFFTILLGFDSKFVSGQCLDNQRTSLLQMKSTLQFNSSFSTKLINWNTSSDCCQWTGVSCDKGGHITGLDLNNESINGGIDNSSGLFSFQYLQSLNLGNNNFNYIEIPSGFSNLTSLTTLNLSNSGFSGQIPFEFSNLRSLVVLDLSSLYFAGIPSLRLENPNLSMLVQNLTELTELYLDGVNISAQGRKWCGALSASLLRLQVLSLSNCYLSGPIDSSLEKLQSLSVIRLSQNNLSTQVPDFFANFSNLTVLRLSFCNLNGTFPEKIFQVSTLRTVDLSANDFLEGSFPEFHQNGSLQILVVSYTNFSKNLPNSIGNLRNLSRIDLANCNFSGAIPSSMANLSELVYLDLSSNMFTGPIPSFQKCKNVIHIDFSRNDLNGSIPFNYSEGLLKLVSFDLRFNSFTGTIPLSLFSLPSLQKFQLSNNKFGGQIPEFSSPSRSLIDTFDVSSNNLTGPIPQSVFHLQTLNILLLSSNKFTGRLKVDNFSGFPNLTTLDLSFNNLSIDTSFNNSRSSSFPQLTRLILASCKLQNFPDLGNQSRLVYLDLSDNQIDGDIPSWIWNVGNGTLRHLNLSCNLLVGLQEPYVIPNLSVLDLHYNRLGGIIPIPGPGFAIYVDYSSNNFNSSIPPDIGNNISFASFFSLSNNSLTGTIPESICNTGFLQVLDLSNNGLSGPIPPCLVENSSKTLGVLNLRNNKLTGNILGTFPSSCSLKTLDLNGNHLEGQVPKSLENCSYLEVLNLGNNKINDVYPCFLKNSTNLRVLVLRSNSFQGGIRCTGSIKDSWPNLQIIDLAFNKFDDELPPRCFLSWKAMTVGENNSQSQLNHLQFEFLRLNHFYYQDRVTVTNKGLQMELVKILTVFTSIDFSSNGFHGTIPDTVGALKSLYVLNLSHNVLTGPIPSSIGNLAQLGSLDLSSNKLNGSIPVSLANLSFLSFLNLSYNSLVGRIPIGTQIQSFTDTSFSGNEGLCGLPLNNNCYDSPPTTYYPGSRFMPFKEFHWQFIFTGLGYGVGAGIVAGPLMFWKKLRIWCDEQTDKLVLTILSSLGFVYTSCDDLKVEGEENEDEDSDDDEDSREDEHETEGEAIRGRYCLFCSKLDICRKKIIHNPKCNCHDPPSKSSFSSSSSSFSPLAENAKF